MICHLIDACESAFDAALDAATLVDEWWVSPLAALAKPSVAAEPIIDIHQHTNYRDRSNERLLHHHLTWHSHFHFGQGRMRIDQAMLFEGTLRILELEAILPDGLVASYKPGDQEERQIRRQAVGAWIGEAPSPVRIVAAVGVGGAIAGVGVTVGAVTHIPSIDTIHVAEISRDIVSMSDAIYEPGARPLSDPRVRLHIEDGRMRTEGSH